MGTGEQVGRGRSGDGNGGKGASAGQEGVAGPERTGEIGWVPNRILFLFTTVHSAAALTKYLLLHSVCTQLGHTTSSWLCL